MVNTAFLLMAQYNAQVVVPLPEVSRDFFGGLSRVQFLARVDRGEIRSPVTRMEKSQRGLVGIRLFDQAADVDVRVTASREAFEPCRGAN